MGLSFWLTVGEEQTEDERLGYEQDRDLSWVHRCAPCVFWLPSSVRRPGHRRLAPAVVKGSGADVWNQGTRSSGHRSPACALRRSVGGWRLPSFVRRAPPDVRARAGKAKGKGRGQSPSGKWRSAGDRRANGLRREAVSASRSRMAYRFRLIPLKNQAGSDNRSSVT